MIPSAPVQVWAYTSPTDLRKGFNGLYGLVVRELQRDPLDGEVFLFVNRRRTNCKVLHWDGTGYVYLRNVLSVVDQPEVEQTEKLLLLDEADLACPDYGQGLKAIHEQYESSEMVDAVKISYQLVTVKRQKYSCSCAHIETADGPERAVAGG